MNPLSKRALILAAFIIGMMLPLAAQTTQVVVAMHDGTQQSFYLSEEDRMYFEDNAKLVIEEGFTKSTVKIPLADIRKMTCHEMDGTLENTLNNIKRDNCSDFIFSIFEYPDHFGHGFDYRSEVNEYMQAFVSSEKTGMEIIRAIESRADYSEEDWLILVTSDHGGYNFGHGGPTLEERITFIISNKSI